MKALVVDDDAMNREVLRRMMSMGGWSVQDVRSGKLAIEACAQFRFDLVLVDFIMPGMNGYETAKAIRDLYAAQDHRASIIAVTGSDNIDSQESLVFDGVLAKPFTADELKACIDLVARKPEP
jgi:CheY-like chemotaxis protein